MSDRKRAYCVQSRDQREVWHLSWHKTRAQAEVALQHELDAWEIERPDDELVLHIWDVDMPETLDDFLVFLNTHLVVQ